MIRDEIYCFDIFFNTKLQYSNLPLLKESYLLVPFVPAKAENDFLNDPGIFL